MRGKDETNTADDKIIILNKHLKLSNTRII